MVVLEVIFLLSKILIDPSVVKVSLIIYFIWKIFVFLFYFIFTFILQQKGDLWS